MEGLIETHQRIPGSITRALIERIYRVPKKRACKVEIIGNSYNSVSNITKVTEENNSHEIKTKQSWVS